MKTIKGLFSSFINNDYVKLSESEKNVKKTLLTYGIQNLVPKQICAGQVYFDNSFDNKSYYGHYEIYESKNSDDNNIYIFINGRGKMKFKNGSEYDGYWKDSKPYGNGFLVMPNGDKFIGIWNNNLINGEGIIEYHNGDKYYGNIKTVAHKKQIKYIRHGKGKMNFANYDYFEGMFKDDYFDGKGVLSFANGETYEGEFYHGKKHGKGKIYYETNDYEIDGIWKDDIKIT